MRYRWIERADEIAAPWGVSIDETGISSITDVGNWVMPELIGELRKRQMWKQDAPYTKAIAYEFANP